RLVHGAYSAIDDDGKVGAFALKAVHDLVAKRRNLAVLLRTQALEPGLARVHDEYLAAGVGGNVDEAAEKPVTVAVVDADPALHRHRHRDRSTHRRHAARHQLRLRHQAGAEAAGLHPVAGTADVEVDLVEAGRLGDGGGAGQ